MATKFCERCDTPYEVGVDLFCKNCGCAFTGQGGTQGTPGPAPPRQTADPVPYAQSGYNFGQENNAGQPNGQAIASMVLGIVGVLCIFSTALVIPAPIGVILGIIALILGINAKKKQPSGMATAGIVLGIVSIVFCLLGFIACVACGLAGLGALAGL